MAEQHRHHRSSRHSSHHHHASAHKHHKGVAHYIAWGIIWVGIVLVIYLGLSAALVYGLKTVPIRWTPLMSIRKAEAREAGRPYTEQQTWQSFDALSPELIRAVIASEDNLFLQHHGFSEQGIRNAIQEKKETGKVRHGGSTISQQTAKNVFTTGRRSWIRKFNEAWFTFLIENIWGKRRIMEVYLNVAEWGDGIYGAEAASRKYFHHSAMRLSRSESALLAVCLPSPRKYSVTNPGPYVRKRQQHIIGLMPKLGPLRFPDEPQQELNHGMSGNEYYE